MKIDTGKRLGSSPLTRGKRRAPRGREFTRRLIPADAGKTGRRSRARRPCWAHPRSRGENAWAAITEAFYSGSSPLTRGKLSLTGVPWWIPGLIPAHAGKTVFSTPR